MKRVLFLLVIFYSFNIFAMGPAGKDLGFGIVIGDPVGGTLKYWTSEENALNFNVGSSYFGKPRLGLDYLWHFKPFALEQLQLFAGPGLAVGVGDNEKDKDNKFYHIEKSKAGIAVRGIIGLAFVPKKVPFELFIEMGPLVGIAPEVGSAFDIGVGFRFYP